MGRRDVPMTPAGPDAPVRASGSSRLEERARRARRRRAYLANLYGPAVLWLVVVAPIQWAFNGWSAGMGHVFAATTMAILAHGQLTRYRLGYFRGRQSIRELFERFQKTRRLDADELRARYEPWDWS